MHYPRSRKKSDFRKISSLLIDKMISTRFLLQSAVTVPVSLTGIQLTYTILRTVNGELPVYKVFKGNGRIVNTVVKHVRGDMDALRKDLAQVCESPVKVHMGSVEIRGIHTWKVKEYFESIGI